MDAAFLLEERLRLQFSRSIMESYGCTYICFWSYIPHPSNCLLSMAGYYNEEDDNGISRWLFDEYRQSIIPLIDNDRLPGLAFNNNRHYIEIQGLELQTVSSTEAQRNFYREARIQKAAFMGCRSGEIELGLSNNNLQMNLEMEMKKLFPEDFARRTSSIIRSENIPHLIVDHQIRPSSSSSSLRSLDSPSDHLYSPPILNTIPTTTSSCHVINTPVAETILPATSSSFNRIEEANSMVNDALTQIRGVQLPLREGEDAAIARAYLAVLSSFSQSHQRNTIPPECYRTNTRAAAFERYSKCSPGLSVMSPSNQVRRREGLFRGPSMFKRAISYYRRLNNLRREQILANRASASCSSQYPSASTSTQVHHMISERKRREKLNESFQALRALLPPGTKKDKASLLMTTRDYLTSLNAQIAELIKRNKQLETHLTIVDKSNDNDEKNEVFSNERVNVRITPISESTSLDESILDLRVIVRGECCSLDLAIRVLEFLKRDNNVSLVSMEGRTQVIEGISFNHLNLRLQIAGEWDQSTFQEAVRRVVDELAQ